MQRLRESQAHLVVIERKTFDFLERLREVDGRTTEFCGHFSQSPPASRFACQDDLGPINESASRGSGANFVCGTRTERAMYECQRQAVGLQRLGGVPMESVPKNSHEDLCSRINARAFKQPGRSDFTQRRCADADRKTGITARDGVANLISLVCIEEEHLVHFCDGVIVAEMPHVNSPIRKHELRLQRSLFGRASLVAAVAADISNGGRRAS